MLLPRAALAHGQFGGTRVEHHREACLVARRQLPLGLLRPTAVRLLRGEVLDPQLVQEDRGLGAGGPRGVGGVGGPRTHGFGGDDSTVDDEHVERWYLGREHALRVAREQGSLDPDPEADARDRGATHLGGETVVPASPADRVLGRVERLRRELERRAGVVVEPAHETRLELERDPECLQTLLHPLEVGRSLGRQMLGELRRPLHDLDHRGILGVEDAQRVVGEHPGEVVAERARVRFEVLAQSRDVRDAALGVAHRVQLEPHPREAERGEEPRREVDDLDVEIGVG